MLPPLALSTPRIERIVRHAVQSHSLLDYSAGREADYTRPS